MKLSKILFVIFVVINFVTKTAGWSLGSGQPAAVDEFGQAARKFFVDDFAVMAKYKTRATLVTRVPIKKSGKMYAALSRLFGSSRKNGKRSGNRRSQKQNKSKR